MFADVEVISNNTYGYNQFTYSIPHKFKTKLSIGSFVKVEFRNKIFDALVVNLKSKTHEIAVWSNGWGAPRLPKMILHVKAAGSWEKRYFINRGGY